MFCLDGWKRDFPFFFSTSPTIRICDADTSDTGKPPLVSSRARCLTARAMTYRRSRRRHSKKPTAADPVKRDPDLNSSDRLDRAVERLRRSG
jgi:hypothetical protein